MKTLKYIPNNDRDFYNDIQDYLKDNNINIEEFEYKPNFLLPKFIKKYKLDNEIKKENKLTISFKPVSNLDIYLHRGKLDNDTLKAIKTAKQVVVNSYTQKSLIEKRLGRQDNINILYPFVDAQKKDRKALKQKIFKDVDISNPDEHIILFTAKNFKSNGIKEFMDIIASLKQRNFVAFIVGDKDQIEKSKFIIDKYQEHLQHIYFIELRQKDYTLDDLFAISDIFILPTQRTIFSINTLKAMAYKNIVMIPSSNGASEIVDAFAIMESPTDTMVGFKIDAVLLRKKDLKLIKKTNKEMAKNYTKKRYLESLVTLIDSF